MFCMKGSYKKQKKVKERRPLHKNLLKYYVKVIICTSTTFPRCELGPRDFYCWCSDTPLHARKPSHKSEAHHSNPKYDPYQTCFTFHVETPICRVILLTATRYSLDTGHSCRDPHYRCECALTVRSNTEPPSLSRP